MGETEQCNWLEISVLLWMFKEERCVKARKLRTDEKRQWHQSLSPPASAALTWAEEKQKAELPQLGNRSDSHKHCFSSSRFGKKFFFYQVQESEWVLPAAHPPCSPSMGKFCQQHIIIGFIQANTPPARGHRSHNPTEIIRGCVHTWPLAWEGVFAFLRQARGCW